MVLENIIHKDIIEIESIKIVVDLQLVIKENPPKIINIIISTTISTTMVTIMTKILIQIMVGIIFNLTEEMLFRIKGKNYGFWINNKHFKKFISMDS
jgi:hypothetical protein